MSRFVVVLRYWLTYGRAGEITKSTAGMVGPVKYVKTNSICNIIKFVWPCLNTFETSL